MIEFANGKFEKIWLKMRLSVIKVCKSEKMYRKCIKSY